MANHMFDAVDIPIQKGFEFFSELTRPTDRNTGFSPRTFSGTGFFQNSSRIV